MDGFRVDDHDVFQRAALLADLQVAVAVGAFVVQVHRVIEGVVLRVVKADFFRDDEQAPGRQGPADLSQQREPVIRASSPTIWKEYRGKQIWAVSSIRRTRLNG